MATFGTFVAGQVLTAAELNSAGTWSTYTPSWTQSATITKTVNWARYSQLNKLVQVQVKMTSSAAGTANNVIKVGLPVNASSNNFVMGYGLIIDASLNSGTIYPIVPVYDTTSTVKFVAPTVSGDSDYDNSYVGQTASQLAFTLASSDIIFLTLTYEAA